MQLLIACIHHRISLDKRILVENHRLIMQKLLQIRSIVCLDEFHDIAIQHLELEDMGSLLDNRVFSCIGTLHHQRITSNIEIYRLAGRIRIVDGVTLHAKDNIIFIITIQPDALKHFLGSSILLYSDRILTRRLLSAAGHRRQEACAQQYVNNLFHLFTISYSKYSASSKDSALLRSFSESNTFSPSIGHLIPMVSSFQRILASA